MLERFHKLSLVRKIALILFAVILFLYAILMVVQFDFLVIVPNYRYVKLYWVLSLTIILSILLLIIIEKKYDFFTIFNILWIPLFIGIFIGLSFTPYTLRKLDFIFSKEVKDFKVEYYKEAKFWHVRKFTHQNNSLYFNQHENWDDIYKGKFKLFKSRFVDAYHLRKDE